MTERILDDFDTIAEYLTHLGTVDNAACIDQMLADAVGLACFPSSNDTRLFEYLTRRGVDERAIGTLWAAFDQARNRTTNRRNDAAETIASMRAWLHRVDLKHYANYADQYRSRERDLVIADAILDVCAECGRLTGVSISYRTIMRRCNVSLRTVHKALAAGGDDSAAGSLVGWFVVVDAAPGDGHATTYSLRTNMVNTPPQSDDAGGSDTQHGKHLKERYEGVYHVGGSNAATFTHDTFRNYRFDDAFAQSMTPITAAAAAERGLSERYMLTDAYRRRLNAGAPSLGRVALVVVDALVAAGGVADLDELRIGGRSRHTIGKALARLAEVKLIDVEGGTATLRDDWEAHLVAIRGLMPTAGALARRIAADAKRALADIEQRERDNRRTGAKLPDWLDKRKAAALADLQRYDPTWYHLHIAHRLPSRISAGAHMGPNAETPREIIQRLRQRAGVLARWELDLLRSLELAAGTDLMAEIA